MFLLTSCTRHEGFHDCSLYPDLNDEMMDYYAVVNLQKQIPLTPQQGLQVLMGTQGVLECKFTGM